MCSVEQWGDEVQQWGDEVQGLDKNYWTQTINVHVP